MYTYTHKKRKGREKSRPEKSIQISKLIGYILYWGASVRAEAGLGRFPRGLFISRARRAVVEIQSQPLRPAKLPTSSGYIECGYRMQPRDPTVHRLMSWTRPIPAEESWEWALGQKVSGRRGPEVGLTARWPQRPKRRLFFLLRVFGSSRVLWIKRGHPTLPPLLCMLLFCCMYCLFSPFFACFSLCIRTYPHTYHSPFIQLLWPQARVGGVSRYTWLPSAASCSFPSSSIISFSPASPPPFCPLVSPISRGRGGISFIHTCTRIHTQKRSQTSMHAVEWIHIYKSRFFSYFLKQPFTIYH